MHPTIADFDPALSGRIASLLEARAVPGASVAVLRGADEFLSCYGRRRAGADLAVTADTAFDVGSCAKSYVATAIAILATDGKLGLDDPVRRFVPELELDEDWISAHVTIRDLLANRTGLARQRPLEAFPDPDMPVAELLARLRHFPRVRPFRCGYVYFNLGFILCALIVERVSGLAYAEFLASRLFAPLGMTHSASGPRALERFIDIADGHTFQEGRVIELGAALYPNIQGAGFVYSSGADALRWLRFHMMEDGYGLIAPGLMAELHRPHTVIPSEEAGLMHRVPEASLSAYCLGWWTSELASRRLVQHSGGTIGWRAFTSFIPRSGLGVAVYLNSAQNVQHAVAYMVLEALLGLPGRDWTKILRSEADAGVRNFRAFMERSYPVDSGSGPALPLDRYAGRYVHPAAGAVEIARDGEGLLATQVDGRLWDMRLAPLGGGIFEAALVGFAARDYLPAPARVRFVVDGGSPVAFEDSCTVYRRC
jgi:CubicO group peptidase (beta-lactamase class C family)